MKADKAIITFRNEHLGLPEIVHINAEEVEVTVLDDRGQCLFSGSIAALANIASNYVKVKAK